MLTKTDIRVLELFASRIVDSFTIREVSRLICKDLKIVHTSVRKLIGERFILKGKHDGLRLDYRNNVRALAYIEGIRAEDFLRGNALVKDGLGRILEKSETKLFILLVFGSYASGTHTRKSDIDILAVLPEYDEDFERMLGASLSTINCHINLIGEDSFREMLDRREEMNIINETLNNHVLLYGAEAYYSLLGERDVR